MICHLKSHPTQCEYGYSTTYLTGYVLDEELENQIQGTNNEYSTEDALHSAWIGGNTAFQTLVGYQASAWAFNAAQTAGYGTVASRLAAFGTEAAVDTGFTIGEGILTGDSVGEISGQVLQGLALNTVFGFTDLFGAEYDSRILNREFVNEGVNRGMYQLNLVNGEYRLVNPISNYLPGSRAFNITDANNNVIARFNNQGEPLVIGNLPVTASEASGETTRYFGEDGRILYETQGNQVTYRHPWYEAYVDSNNNFDPTLAVAMYSGVGPRLPNIVSTNSILQLPPYANNTFPNWLEEESWGTSAFLEESDISLMRDYKRLGYSQVNGYLRGTLIDPSPGELYRFNRIIDTLDNAR